jgi:hypothetical protein
MNFVLTNIEVFLVIFLLNKTKRTNTENYLREFKAVITSLAKFECANLKLHENEYDANFNTSKVTVETLRKEATGKTLRK